MGKAALIAWREIRWEIFGDRGAVIRTGFFALLPILFVLSGRGMGRGGPNDISILVLALQSTLIPALSGVALIASTFTQEKENGTLVPLLASPVRDIDIVVGKLLGMVAPVMLICAGSLAVFYLQGDGVAADKARAASMWDEACRAGHARSCSNLGFMYKVGDGVATDEAKALSLLKKACELGMADACRWLTQQGRVSPATTSTEK